MSLAVHLATRLVRPLLWQNFFERLDNNDITGTKFVAKEFEIAKDMALNHINNDLSAALKNNGIGKNSVWGCVGDKVDECQKRIVGGISAGDAVVGSIWENYDVQSIRDRMRDRLRE